MGTWSSCPGLPLFPEVLGSSSQHRPDHVERAWGGLRGLLGDRCQERRRPSGIPSAAGGKVWQCLSQPGQQGGLHVPVPLCCVFSPLSPTASLPPPTGSNPSPLGSPEPTSDSRTLAQSKCQHGRSPEGRTRESRSPHGADSPGVILERGTALQSTERGDLQHGPGLYTASVRPPLSVPCPKMEGICSRNQKDIYGTWMALSPSSLQERVSNLSTGSLLAQGRTPRVEAGSAFLPLLPPHLQWSCCTQCCWLGKT